MNTQEKIDSIVLHKDNVLKNTIIMGEKLIKLGGNLELVGKKLIANGYIHDYSKFFGIEFEHMWNGNPDVNSLKLAVKQHQLSNPHHPEYWGGIVSNMPKEYLAEMICDLKARSQEFGTSLMDYINNEFITKHNIKNTDFVYKDMTFYVDLLCEKPFKKVD